MSFICRFAPSPTGPLHIGGVRTALFNWLLAKKNKGKFYLRIEDTDKERSKDEFKKQIIESLSWVGIKHDDKEFIQSKNINKHKEVAEDLIKQGFAYKCYCSEEEIKEQKEKCKKQGIPYIYNRKWRDAKDLKIPNNIKPVIRFKSKISGNTVIKDLVQGDINVSNSIIEDFVILRQDGSPTYQLSATVDDHTMKISHVIRGDDHKINTFKQKQIYEAMKWEVPEFAHIPLIHSEKGSKLSKRDKSSTIDDYVKIGILPDALRNYLLRLGWAYKDKEIFSLDESINLFNLSGVGKSPSKLDMSRILSLNEYYIKNIDEKNLFEFFKNYAKNYKKGINTSKEGTILKSLNFLKNKAKTLDDIYQNCQYILNEEVNIEPEDAKLLDINSKKIISDFLKEFKNLNSPNKENLEKLVNSLISKYKTNFKGVGQPLRIALIGSKFGPGIYNIILSLTKDDVVKRISKIN
ncbi:MAG: glutamate--tRNA ligase [Candidatus Marinimicrobia bacterium]|nr:glutamate--tRNA ligase [Candidatus Neomarinimicrobiota bacterium]|tara:strand:+ start:9824 stop:11215 length:1392 start_codon:yes stop_codon:yes gene_type:complete